MSGNVNGGGRRWPKRIKGFDQAGVSSSSMPDYPRGFVGLRGEPLSRGGSSLGHADPSGECYRLIDMADSWLLTFRSL